jgi:streptogramin lyase
MRGDRRGLRRGLDGHLRARRVSRIDPAKASVTGHVALPMTSDGESSIGVGEGAVWALIDGSGCRLCAVARIDPKTLKVTNRYPVPGGASAVRAGLGGVWITSYQTDSVVRLDPSTGKVVATIPVAPGPRFFDVGAGAVWVMAQSAGALCRIDPADNRLVGCTVIDPAGVDGGDLTVGNGFVWFRGTEALVAQVDPKSGRVVRRVGPGEGSGSAVPAPGSSGSQHMTYPSCTECPCSSDRTWLPDGRSAAAGSSDWSSKPQGADLLVVARDGDPLRGRPCPLPGPAALARRDPAVGSIPRTALLRERVVGRLCSF